MHSGVKEMADRPADILSPATNQVLSPADAREAGRVGYEVFPVVDVCGAWDGCEAQAAMARVSRGGAEVVTTFALGCELQADWKLPSGDAMSGPFTNQLSGYGWVAGNFWNNASQRAVPDLFGTVK